MYREGKRVYIVVYVMLLVIAHCEPVSPLLGIGMWHHHFCLHEIICAFCQTCAGVYKAQTRF